MNIQIYMKKKNFDVQKAERFFKERRIPYQLVDLNKHKLGPRELDLFAAKLGAKNLIDRDDKKVLEHPAAHMSSEKYILEAILENPRLLRAPIVRNGNRITLGDDSATWLTWLDD